MNASEFREWFDHHVACFGKRVVSWVADSGTATRDIWYDVLRDVELDDAKQASSMMVSGDKPMPKGYSAIPSSVRRLARKLRHERNSPEKGTRGVTNGPRGLIDGQYVFDCPICRDYGAVEIWQKETQWAAIREEELTPMILRSGSVACTCRRGDLFANQKRGMRRLGENDVITLGSSDRDGVERLLEWADLMRARVEKQQQSLVTQQEIPF